MKKTIGFIGCGNMGRAVLNGLLCRKLYNKKQVFIFDINKNQVSNLKRSCGIQAAKNIGEILEKSEIVFLAVKPQQLKTVSREIKGNLKRNQVVVSILAGVSLKALKKHLGPSGRFVRVMPNLGAMLGQSMSVVSSLDKKALKIGETIFKACGEALVLSEKHLDLATAISGSGPAYFFHLMELLEHEGIKQGLSQAEARKLSIQTALGSALLVKNSIYSSRQLREKVTSKGGTTEAALKIFKKYKFSKLINQAVKSAQKRAKELSG